MNTTETKIITKQDIAHIDSLSKAISKLKTPKEISCFLKEILTVNEFKNLSLRWHLLEMLNNGKSQRGIAQELKISLCKITRGAKIMKEKKSITKKLLK
ncbi:TrpR family trp operon transcriptional repressor [Elusimicrobium posterum]|uniref:Trp family transcriptional regulator n=1 Tax=Elusimicrobium posterum TaxID=3116653 RepID=UPI003C72204D